MKNSYSSSIPDEILRLCCRVFRNEHEAVKASPIEDGQRSIQWATLPPYTEPIEYDPHSEKGVPLVTPITHRVKVVQVYDGEWLWQLEGEGDRHTFEALRKQYRGDFS